MTRDGHKGVAVILGGYLYIYVEKRQPGGTRKGCLLRRGHGQGAWQAGRGWGGAHHEDADDAELGVRVGHDHTKLVHVCRDQRLQRRAARADFGRAGLVGLRPRRELARDAHLGRGARTLRGRYGCYDCAEGMGVMTARKVRVL